MTGTLTEAANKASPLAGLVIPPAAWRFLKSATPVDASRSWNSGSNRIATGARSCQFLARRPA